MKEKNQTDQYKHSTSHVRHWFVEHCSNLLRRFTKQTTGGKRYIVIPAPTQKSLLRFGLIVLLAAVIIAIGYQLYRYYGPHSYQLSSVQKLLSSPNETLTKNLRFDDKKQVYSFMNGQTDTAESKQTGASLVSAIIPVDASKGMVITDPHYKIDLTIAPQFAIAHGEQDQNRVVYPFRNHNGWLVYTAEGTGVKEDIVLSKAPGDQASFSYLLTLPDGIEARLESDGSIGIYGNELFVNNIATGTDADVALLKKARENAKKSLLLFVIPSPIVKEYGKQTSQVDASFQIEKNRLTVTAKGLDKAAYPLTIDPSIYIVTAQQFMNGNNETNINLSLIHI